MTTVNIHHDFETYCDLDVTKVGAYRYAQHPSCEVLTLTWSHDGVYHVWVPGASKKVRDAVTDYMDDKATEQGIECALHITPKLPKALRKLAEDPEVQFNAHNAQFEFCIWQYVMARRYDAPLLSPDRFTCTAAMCAAAGLPRALGKVGTVLQLDIEKDKDGKRLLKKFAALQPAKKPSKKNPEGVPPRRILPDDDPEEFAKLVSYNVTDVIAEEGIDAYVPPLSRAEQKFYTLDLVMNTRGIPLDMKAVKTAMPVLTELENRVKAKATELTGGIKPTQRDKMLEFFKGIGLDVENLQAKTLKDVLTLRKDLTDQQRQLIQLRVEGGKASTKKLKKMLEVVCEDGRVRGAFLFFGAHTGRWAGKLIQPQNFTRGEYKPWQQEMLFDILYIGDPDVLEMLYEWPIDAIAQGMRGFLKVRKGKKFVVSDFSAIEARMLAWLANETEVLKIYHANGDVYIRMAAKLYKRDEAELLRLCKPPEGVDPDKKAVGQRKFAKDIVLGCGYQMGGPGFHKNCVMRGINVELEECNDAVKVYRKEHPNIVKFWWDTERCAAEAIKQGRTKANPIRLRNLTFYMESNERMTWLCIGLPSGRPIRYCNPKVEKAERFGKTVDKISYRTEVKGMWIRESTYGGKLVENITQAVARDVMVESMVKAEKRGYACIGTVHDELISEVDDDFGSAHELEEIMRIRPKWCADAPINAEGWEGPRYRK